MAVGSIELELYALSKLLQYMVGGCVCVAGEWAKCYSAALHFSRPIDIL